MTRELHDESAADEHGEYGPVDLDGLRAEAAARGAGWFHAGDPGEVLDQVGEALLGAHSPGCRASDVNEATGERGGDRRRPIVDAELRERLEKVGLHRRLAQVEH